MLLLFANNIFFFVVVGLVWTDKILAENDSTCMKFMIIFKSVIIRIFDNFNFLVPSLMIINVFKTNKSGLIWNERRIM